MYISDIYLVNFQSYQDSHFTFSKNVNLITGSSDSGKTAVIRAISWVLFNDYTTDLLIRKGYKKVEVKIIFNNGYYITRGRYGSKNYYYVQTNNYEEYVNFGKEIPKEIEDIFLFKKVNIINDKYNILISSQLENSFLLSESDSSKANAIGKLVNVDILDNASRNVSKEVRALNSEMNFVKKIISEKETDLKKYDYLDYFKIKLDNLSEIYANLESDSKRLNSFEIIYNKQNELNKRISNGHKYLEKFNTLDELEEIINKLTSNYKKSIIYEELFIIFSKILLEIRDNNSILKELPDTNSLSKIIEKLSNNITTLKFLSPIFDKQKKLESEYNYNNSKLNELKNIKSIYALKNKISNSINCFNELITIREKYKLISESIYSNKLKIKIYNINEITKIIDSIDSKKQKFLEIFTLYRSLSSLNNDINQINKTICKERFVYSVSNNLKKIDDFSLTLRKLIELDNKYNFLKIEYNKTSDLIKKHQLSINDLIKEYKQCLLKEKICPFCLSEIDEEHISKIMEELKK